MGTGTNDIAVSPGEQVRLSGTPISERLIEAGRVNTDQLIDEEARLGEVALLLSELLRERDIVQLISWRWEVPRGRVRRDIREVKAVWAAELKGDIEERLGHAVALRTHLYRVCLSHGQTRTAELQLTALEKLQGLSKLSPEGANIHVDFSWSDLPTAGSDTEDVTEDERASYRDAIEDEDDKD